MRLFALDVQNETPGQWTKWVIVATPTILLVVLIVVWLSDWRFDREGYCTIQRDWFIVLNQALNSWPSQFWSNLTLLGDATVLIPLLSPLILWRAQAWAAILAAAPLASVLSVSAKHFAAVPRPAAFLDQHQFTVIGNALTAKNSFPSGHAITIFAGVAAVLLILAPQSMNRRYWIGLALGMLVAVTVSLSRVAVGAHWPLDALAGGVFGTIAGLFGAALAQRYRKWWHFSPKSMGSCILGAVLMLASLSLIDRALEKLSLGVVLWLAGMCAMVASVWLIKGCIGRFRLDKEGPR